MKQVIQSDYELREYEYINQEFAVDRPHLFIGYVDQSGQYHEGAPAEHYSEATNWEFIQLNLVEHLYYKSSGLLLPTLLAMDIENYFRPPCVWYPDNNPAAVNKIVLIVKK